MCVTSAFSGLYYPPLATSRKLHSMYTEPKTIMNSDTEHAGFGQRQPDLHSEVEAVHKVKRRHSNMWSQCDLRVVEQHGVLCEVQWRSFVALFE